ncbi:hypothetical protein [Marinobacter goseongensis]|uniref:hypothetical protein n=1 Tax=Marinobacter goseongensis TaxID=453838 RepID=UPI002004BA65|nr:hypothetical protein [Marinobacter goseongensis]MCK7553378.1 hypothetical protein [Marinobacter goseongensis]
MFFALADYWKYRRRVGRYSHTRLMEQGFYLATVENFSNYDLYSLGDILFASPADSALSWAIMYCTDSAVSHTALFYSNGVLHDCTTSGVVRHSFANYLDGKSYLCVKHLPGDLDRKAMCNFMDQTLGDGYNWRGVCVLFFHILIGNHHNFVWRLAADFMLLLAVLWAGARFFTPQADYIFGAAAAVYLVVLTVNRVFVKKSLPIENF